MSCSFCLNIRLNLTYNSVTPAWSLVFVLLTNRLLCSYPSFLFVSKSKDFCLSLLDWRAFVNIQEFSSSKQEQRVWWRLMVWWWNLVKLGFVWITVAWSNVMLMTLSSSFLFLWMSSVSARVSVFLWHLLIYEIKTSSELLVSPFSASVQQNFPLTLGSSKIISTKFTKILEPSLKTFWASKEAFLPFFLCV